MLDMICAELAAQYGIPKYKMQMILNSYKEELIRAILDAEEFVLSGLMAVRQITSKPIKRLNPFTNEEIDMPARRQVKLIPSRKIKYRPLQDA